MDTEISEIIDSFHIKNIESAIILKFLTSWANSFLGQRLYFNFLTLQFGF